MAAKPQRSIVHINGLFHISMTCAVAGVDVFDIDAIKVKPGVAVLPAFKCCANNNKFR